MGPVNPLSGMPNTDRVCTMTMIPITTISVHATTSTSARRCLASSVWTMRSLVENRESTREAYLSAPHRINRASSTAPRIQMRISKPLVAIHT